MKHGNTLHPPLRVERIPQYGKDPLICDEFLVIARMNGDVYPRDDKSDIDKDAAYIAAAVNAYPDLVAENERLRGVLEEAKKITDLYFAPWGAAKGAEWEFLSGDIPFTPENALRLIQRALSTEPARRG